MSILRDIIRGNHKRVLYLYLTIRAKSGSVITHKIHELSNS